MLWSLVKVVSFILLATLLAFGASFLQDTPGGVTISFGGREMSLAPLGFVIALVIGFVIVLLLMRIAGLMVAILRFATGDETAIRRYFDRSRERRGYAAIGDAMIALHSGEARVAMAKAEKARKLLHRSDLTRLLIAEAAEAEGDKKKALAQYKELLSDEKTRFAGIRGLMRQKLEQGDTETALKLAEKAFVLRPGNQDVVNSLFDLQSRHSDWTGARKTLIAKQKAEHLPRDLVRRRDAVLSLAEAIQAQARGEGGAARQAAFQATKLAPALVPAAIMAAHAHLANGAKRVAAKVIRTAWQTTPHPELAAAFAAIEPNESPAARIARFQTLLAIQPDHPETRMLSAELHIAAEEFPAAARALGDLAETGPSTRVMALMAAIERGRGESDRVVRGWLARALTAPRPAQWVCTVCDHPHSNWEPVCENCHAFDTLEWRLAPNATTEDTTAAMMLPLIVGELEADEPQPVDDAVAPDEVDIVDEPDDDDGGEEAVEMAPTEPSQPLSSGKPSAAENEASEPEPAPEPEYQAQEPPKRSKSEFVEEPHIIRPDA